MTTSFQNTVYAVPRGWGLYTANEIKADDRYACVAGPFGSNISSKYFVEEGVPVIRGSNLRDDLTRFVSDRLVFVSPQQALQYKPQHVRANDLVFTCWGTIGQVGIIPENASYEEYIISNKQLKLSINRAIANPLFCFYYFASPQYVEYIRSRNIGGAVPGINLGILKSLPIALPSLEEQARIVRVLGAYDDLITNNTRRIELLEKSARQLFEEWFVRLRYPGHEHDKIVDGVPQGWQRTTVPSVIDINPREPSNKGEELWYVPMSAVSQTGMTVDAGFFERRSNHTSVKFRNGDTLFARITPCLENGKTGFVDFLENGQIACGSTEFIVLRGRVVSPEFTYCLSRSDYFRGKAIKSMIGSSGRQRVQETCFNEFVVAVAPRSIMDEFNGFVSSFFRQIKNLRKQNERLVSARDLLLPRLMDGRIEV